MSIPLRPGIDHAQASKASRSDSRLYKREFLRIGGASRRAAGAASVHNNRAPVRRRCITGVRTQLVQELWHDLRIIYDALRPSLNRILRLFKHVQNSAACLGHAVRNCLTHLELELPRVAAVLTLGYVSGARHRRLRGPQRRRTRVKAITYHLRAALSSFEPACEPTMIVSTRMAQLR